MIEILPAMPKGVTGIRVSGRLRGEDPVSYTHLTLPTNREV